MRTPTGAGRSSGWCVGCALLMSVASTAPCFAQDPAIAAQLKASVEAGIESSLITLRVARATSAASEVRRALHEVGMAYADAGLVESAVAYLDSARTLAAEAGDQLQLADSETALGRVYQRIADPRDPIAALVHYARARDARRTLRVAAGRDRLGVGASEQGAELFGNWAAAILAVEESATGESARAALAAAEAGRAQTLLDLASDVPPEHELLDSTFEPRDRHEHIAQLAESADRAIGQAGSPSFLYYQLAEDTLLVWTHTRDRGVEVFRRPLTDEYAIRHARQESLPPRYLNELLPGHALDSLASLVGGLREALGTSDATARVADGIEETETRSSRRRGQTGDWAYWARALARVLVPEEVASRLPPTGDLVVLSHGVLGQVPFGLLPLGADEGAETLGDRFAVRYAPSIAALATLETREAQLDAASLSPAAPDEETWARHVPSALVVGNPTMPRVRVGAERLILNALPGSEDEAIEVASRLGVEPLLGPMALEQTVWARIPTASIIHLATHGIAFGDERRTRDSFVALTPALDGDLQSDADGRLTVAEVLDGDTSLVAELVVLSACQTGLGSISQSEGVLGFPRALLARGARTVLVSLWSVSDEATRLLMSRFYYHWLGRGLTKAEALRSAQNDLRAIPAWRAPQFWAAFQLVGAG